MIASVDDRHSPAYRDRPSFRFTPCGFRGDGGGLAPRLPAHRNARRRQPRRVAARRDKRHSRARESAVTAVTDVAACHPGIRVAIRHALAQADIRPWSTRRISASQDVERPRERTTFGRAACPRL